MRDEQFDIPVTIETEHTGRYLTVTRTAQAASFLIERWPVQKRGPQVPFGAKGDDGRNGAAQDRECREKCIRRRCQGGRGVHSSGLDAELSEILLVVVIAKGVSAMGKDNIPNDNPAPTIDPDNVLDVEALALRTGITGDQAQALIDRIGNDREALEQAARELKKP
jgi:hypothetical protein